MKSEIFVLKSDIAAYYRLDMRISKRTQEKFPVISRCATRIKESNDALRGETPVDIEKWTA